MPYRIRHRPNHPTQAKVYSESGRPLSNRWLSEKKATQQRIAVLISEKQRKMK